MAHILGLPGDEEPIHRHFLVLWTCYEAFKQFMTNLPVSRRQCTAESNVVTSHTGVEDADGYTSMCLYLNTQPSESRPKTIAGGGAQKLRLAGRKKVQRMI